MINNNVASVEDVADSSLSPAGRVTQRCTPGCSPTPSPSQVVQCSSNLADSPASLPSPHPSSQSPSATSLTGHFSFHFDQYEEWTDEVEARMQNELDRMLEDARRVLTEPVPNISELFPDDLFADSVAHQTLADSLASRFAAADEMIRELEAVAEDDDLWEELGMYVPLSPIAEESLADEFVVEEDAHSPPQSFKHTICFEVGPILFFRSLWGLTNIYRSDNGSQTRSASRRRPSHRFHQRLLTSTCDGGGGDGSLLTPTLWRCDCHISIHHIEKQKKFRKLNKIDQRRRWIQTLKSSCSVLVKRQPGLAADYTREFGMQSHGAANPAP
ncbi:hypothetical protein EV363DRAFT_1342185 [Boletus edulis]|nr:hypothetical protein EV363DRAFT_1342185 [Boletus edulis]